MVMAQQSQAERIAVLGLGHVGLPLARARAGFATTGVDTGAAHVAAIRAGELQQATGTKWNVLDFRPGLVGGNCTGVDPCYLTRRAERLGYHPEVILAGRRINDNMGRHVAQEPVRAMPARDTNPAGRR
jgi:UDP-N-acetyl-D-mannosaminuronate dehydrogenase